MFIVSGAPYGAFPKPFLSFEHLEDAIEFCRIISGMNGGINDVFLDRDNKQMYSIYQALNPPYRDHLGTEREMEEFYRDTYPDLEPAELDVLLTLNNSRNAPPYSSPAPAYSPARPIGSRTPAPVYSPGPRTPQPLRRTYRMDEIPRGQASPRSQMTTRDQTSPRNQMTTRDQTSPRSILRTPETPTNNRGVRRVLFTDEHDDMMDEIQPLNL